MALRGAPRRAPRRLVPVAVVLAVLAASAAAPAAADAALLVDHAQADPTVQGGGILGPGKTFDLNETINNSELSLTGVSGVLDAGSTSGVTVNQGSSGYPDLTF